MKTITDIQFGEFCTLKLDGLAATLSEKMPHDGEIYVMEGEGESGPEYWSADPRLVDLALRWQIWNRTGRPAVGEVAPLEVTAARKGLPALTKQATAIL
jgi:hypothetical protein